MNIKKSAVLDVLIQQKAAMSLNELLAILGEDFAERSVRRWLDELVTAKLIEKSGQKKSTRYQALQNKTSVFDTSDFVAVNFIRQPIFKRSPVTYKKQWLESYQPNETFYLSEKNRHELLASNSQHDHKNQVAGTFARQIYNRLLIDLSYNSSRLEGNTYSLLETQRLILEGTEASEKLDEERIMILNHKEAIRHLINTAPKLQISVDEICTLHYLLSDGLVPPQFSGKTRDHGVRIGGSTYSPLESKSQLEKQLFLICEKATAISDPFEQSFFLLTHLAYLQTFTDVNKRTSRLSANIPLIRANLVPLSFNHVEKDDYTTSMLCIYELNDTQPLAELYCQSYVYTCQEYNVAKEILGFNEVRVRFRNLRREVIQHIVINLLTGAALKNYVATLTQQQIPEADQENFTKTVYEDLAELSPPRIVGLGISKTELQNWLEKNANEGSRSIF